MGTPPPHRAASGAGIYTSQITSLCPTRAAAGWKGQTPDFQHQNSGVQGDEEYGEGDPSPGNWADFFFPIQKTKNKKEETPNKVGKTPVPPQRAARQVGSAEPCRISGDGAVGRKKVIPCPGMSSGKKICIKKTQPQIIPRSCLCPCIV